MSKPLFAPDIFSRPRPAFHPAGDDLKADIESILRQHYDFAQDQIQSIEKLEGLEINSRNFKVKTATRTYALKKAGIQAKENDVAAQLSLSQFMLQQGVPFPHIIKTVADNFYAQDGEGRLWILSDFVEGTYFTGTRPQLDVTARIIAGLQSQLEKSGQAQSLPLFSAVNSWQATAEIFTELFERSSEWENLFPTPEADVLLRERAVLERLFQLTAERQKNFTSYIVPVHIDLHPHNILIGDGDVPVIVDIDSLQRADRTQSLGFAIFKLVRQHIVQERPADLAAPAHEFFRLLNITDADIPLYAAKATAEVLRRIGIIASLNMHKANRDWNAVLYIQLAALHEIPHIFATKE